MNTCEFFKTRFILVEKHYGSASLRRVRIHLLMKTKTAALAR